MKDFIRKHRFIPLSVSKNGKVKEGKPLIIECTYKASDDVGQRLVNSLGLSLCHEVFSPEISEWRLVNYIDPDGGEE